MKYITTILLSTLSLFSYAQCIETTIDEGEINLIGINAENDTLCDYEADWQWATIDDYEAVKVKLTANGKTETFTANIEEANLFFTIPCTQNIELKIEVYDNQDNPCQELQKTITIKDK